MRLTTMQCSICGEEMEYEAIELELISRQTMNQPGWYCWTCQMSHHSAQDLFLAEHHAKGEDDKPR
jgi:hypothetical protein